MALPSRGRALVEALERLAPGCESEEIPQCHVVDVGGGRYQVNRELVTYSHASSMYLDMARIVAIDHYGRVRLIRRRGSLILELYEAGLNTMPPQTMRRAA